MTDPFVRANYNILAGATGITVVLVPALAGTDTEAAGAALTAGGGARIYNPTVSAGFTTIQATAVEAADFLVMTANLDTLSAVGTYFLRFGVGLSTAETVFERIKFAVITAQSIHPPLEFRSRRRVATAGNSRLSASVASIAGGSETANCHLAILRGA